MTAPRKRSDILNDAISNASSAEQALLLWEEMKQASFEEVKEEIANRLKAKQHEN